MNTESFGKVLTFKRGREEIIASKSLFECMPGNPVLSKLSMRRKIVKMCYNYKEAFGEPVTVSFGSKHYSYIPLRYSQETSPKLSPKKQTPQWRKLDQTRYF